jgi:hypothetical protein
MDYDQSIETAFSPYLWLELITDQNFFEAAREKAKANSETELAFIKGYEYLIIASLHQLIDLIIRNPQPFDLPVDEGFRDAWSYGPDRGREALTRFIQKDSPLSYVFNLVNAFWNDLLRANQWDELNSILVRISEWTRHIRKGFHYSCRCRTEKRKLRKNPDIILKMHALDFLWPHMGHLGFISGMYATVFSRSGEFPIENDDELDRERRYPSPKLDHHHNLSFPKRPPVSWAPGYIFSLILLIQKLDENRHPDVNRLLIKLKKISTWQGLSHLQNIMPLAFKASRKIHVIKVRPFPKSCLRNMMLPTRPKFDANKLLGIMGSPLKVVETDTLSAPSNFERLLRGSIDIAREYKEKVRVIRLAHKECHYTTAYSLAIFLPVYTMISNWSSWWVFFDLYLDKASGEDNESAVIRNRIIDILRNFRDDIDLEEYAISKEEFLSIAEEPGFVWLRDELKRAKNINWNIRGALPEILGATYFGALNYHPIRVNFKPSFLNGKELDVVAIEWGKSYPSIIRVIETKGSSVSDDHELQAQINKFSEKIKVINKNRKRLAQELGVSMAPRKARAIFVSLADLAHVRVKVPTNVELWSFGRFLNELQSNHIPTWHLQLLRKSSVAVRIGFGESLLKAFF